MISNNERAINILEELKINDAQNILIYNESSFDNNKSFLNNTKSVLADLYHAIVGKVSNLLGKNVEKSVQSTINFLKDTLKTNSKIILNAHSQGAIILKNALSILKETLNEDEWDMLKTNTQINLYGSPCGTFSDDLKIIEYKTKFDFVNLFKGFNTKNNNYNLKILNGYGHSFDTYNEGLKEIK